MTPGRTDPRVAAGGTGRRRRPTETEAAADTDAVLVRDVRGARSDGDSAPRPATPRRGHARGHGDAHGVQAARALETRAPEGVFDARARAECVRAGDDWECSRWTLDNALRRTGKPCDVLGLYREVCMHGGYITRESAKRRVKMGHGFAQTHNFYKHHTYTDIGNKPLDLYERFLLPYENEHPEDILVERAPRAATRPSRRARACTRKARCDACRATYHRRCAGAGAFQRGDRASSGSRASCARRACGATAAFLRRARTRPPLDRRHERGIGIGIGIPDA